ncbi:MAG TPA: DinB family protein [Bryobacteraceae bacterium]|nr:DinB family protein [Bryobacteraceae bacterium]
MLQDLVHHKNYANTALLNAIAAHEQASVDPELRHLLHHIILANRFWLSLFVGQPFDLDKEARVPESLGVLAEAYRETHELESRWIGGLQAAELDRLVQTPFIPGRSLSLAQALMQVCLHSHGHRAQCAAKLRALEGDPPPMDFIVWLKDRPGFQSLSD